MGRKRRGRRKPERGIEMKKEECKKVTHVVRSSNPAGPFGSTRTRVDDMAVTLISPTVIESAAAAAKTEHALRRKSNIFSK